MKPPFKNQFLLAPMEEVNDPAFRMLCKKAGAGGTYTGLTHPLSRQKLILDDKPVLQIFCTKTDGIKEFFKKYESQVVGFDFNLGCPAKTAKAKGFGSFLKDLKVIEEILKEMRNSTKKPISVKFRKSEIAFDILEIAEKYCDYVCIHPRTQAQGYSGKADLDFALQIKKATKLPVIYSGDVNDKNAQELAKKFDYVMVGRFAIGNPNVFAKLTNTPVNITFQDYLPLAKKYELYSRQIKFQAMNFTKGIRDSSKIRVKLSKCKNVDEITSQINKSL